MTNLLSGKMSRKCNWLYFATARSKH